MAGAFQLATRKGDTMKTYDLMEALSHAWNLANRTGRACSVWCDYDSPQNAWGQHEYTVLSESEGPPAKRFTLVTTKRGKRTEDGSKI